jgi:hypothetical protein
MNVARGVLPRFYIFSGESLHDDYIKLNKLNTFMAMQKRT